jgi:hypothetical protein
MLVDTDFEKQCVVGKCKEFHCQQSVLISVTVPLKHLTVALLAAGTRKFARQKLYSLAVSILQHGDNC